MKNTLIIVMLLASVAAFSITTTTTSNINQSVKSADGTQMGQSATDKIGFYGTTPLAQQADASQVAFTDNGTGTVSDTIAAGICMSTLTFPVALKEITDGDIVTAHVVGYKFKLISFVYIADVESSTAAKLSTLNLEIDTTNTTGGALALTTALTDLTGERTAATAITAANTGSATATISLEGASTTAFVEGSGSVLILIQNMDCADTLAAIADKINDNRQNLVDLGFISGAAPLIKTYKTNLAKIHIIIAKQMG